MEANHNYTIGKEYIDWIETVTLLSKKRTTVGNYIKLATTERIIAKNRPPFIC
jgi:hypothetical protein